MESKMTKTFRAFQIQNGGRTGESKQLKVDLFILRKWTLWKPKHMSTPLWEQHTHTFSPKRPLLPLIPSKEYACPQWCWSTVCGPFCILRSEVSYSNVCKYLSNLCTIAFLLSCQVTSITGHTKWNIHSEHHCGHLFFFVISAIFKFNTPDSICLCHDLNGQ